MKITSLRVTPFEPSFRGGAFAMGHVTQLALKGRMLALELEDGSLVVTEICRAPTLPHEAIAPREDRFLDRVPGMEVGDLTALAAEALAEDPQLVGLAAALDLAVMQVSAQRARLPLWVLLGGAQQQDLPETRSHGQMTPDALVQAMTQDGTEAPVVQIKLGSGDTTRDLTATRRALDCLWDDQRLLADFNGALDLATARDLLPRIDDPRLIWEEPCTTYDDNLTLSQMLDVPVMLDQCLASPDDFARGLRDGVSHMAIKPTRLGGLGPARILRDMVAAAGVTLRVDGPWSGPIWAAANLHLALGTPPERLLGAMDTSAPLDLPGPDRFRAGPGRIAPPGGAGLGTGLTPGRLEGLS